MTKRMPAERKIPVQIDTATVYASSSRNSVGIKILDDPEVHVRERRRSLECARDSDTSRLVTMDTTDDQHLATFVRITELDHSNLASLCGSPERFMTNDRAVRDTVSRRRESKQADCDAAQARHSAPHYASSPLG